MRRLRDITDRTATLLGQESPKTFDYTKHLAHLRHPQLDPTNSSIDRLNNYRKVEMLQQPRARMDKISEEFKRAGKLTRSDWENLRKQLKGIQADNDAYIEGNIGKKKVMSSVKAFNKLLDQYHDNCGDNNIYTVLGTLKNIRPEYNQVGNILKTGLENFLGAIEKY